MPFNLKKDVIRPVKRFLAKIKAATIGKLPKRPRRTAWKHIDDGILESRWERIRDWWRKL